MRVFHIGDYVAEPHSGLSLFSVKVGNMAMASFKSSRADFTRTQQRV